MERGDQRVLFSGDVIMSLLGQAQSNAPMARPLGTYAAYLAPRFRGSAHDYLSTLRRLRALPAPRLVLPGHPIMDPVPQSPLMSQRRWEALLDTGIHEMERLQTRYEKDGPDFLDGTPKQLLPGLFYLGEFKQWPVYGFFAGSRFFLIDAPGSAGLSAFVTARLEQLGTKPVAPDAVLLTSGNPEATAGLDELIRKWHPRVVATQEAWKAIKKTCPAGTQILTPRDLSGKRWFPVMPVMLRGRGVGPVAYLLQWQGKPVLFSGRIPIKPTPITVKGLAADFSQGQGNAGEYRTSLQRLGQLKPHLWLPALPGNSQNANLYDNEWKDILTQNENLFR